MRVLPSEHKLQQLYQFVDEVCASEQAIQAVVAIGSVAAGRATERSDIDAVVFMDPVDLYAVPAEAAWLPIEGTFHSIFSVAAERTDAIRLDFLRLDLRVWFSPGFEWPEPRTAELASGRVVFDRNGEVSTLISQRTRYSDDIRVRRVDQAVTWLDQILSNEILPGTWNRYGAEIAFDRLNSAYDWLAQALFAVNSQWRPWRNREMAALLELPWLPNAFGQLGLIAIAGVGHDWDGYVTRAAALKTLFEGVLKRSIEVGIYSSDPISEAFVRGHDEPGRAWNIAEWSAIRAQRRNSGK